MTATEARIGSPGMEVKIRIGEGENSRSFNARVDHNGLLYDHDGQPLDSLDAVVWHTNESPADTQLPEE